MTYDIVGIGNPLLDVTVEINEEILTKNNLTKGHMHLIDKQTYENILNSIDKTKMHEGLGGSVANTLASANSIGVKTLYLGSIGDDEYGQQYEQMTKESGVDCKFVRQKTPQGMCLVLITPDGERTFATYLGASIEFKKENIDEEVIKNTKILHIEAYQLDSPNQTEAIIHAMNIALENNILISMDLADPSLIQRHKKILEELLEKYIDIIFVNEHEAKEFTNLFEEEAVKYLSKFCKYAIVKLGEKGSLIMFENKLTKIPIHKVEVINTNGAGDTYAGAFLACLIKNLPIEQCGKIASYLSSQVVASPYSRIMKNMENEINFI
ncbi:MAG: adenosine kinase [Candidatus Woesearchaeota archaeon]